MIALMAIAYRRNGRRRILFTYSMNNLSAEKSSESAPIPKSRKLQVKSESRNNLLSSSNEFHASNNDLASTVHQGNTVNHATTVWGNTSTTQNVYDDLAVPAFLIVTEGVDYKRGKFIVSGGGGSIYEAEVISPELTRRTEGKPMILKKVSRSLNTMSERDKISFYQEVYHIIVYFSCCLTCL